MLVSTRQMSRAHALHDYYPAVSCNGKLLERVTTATGGPRGRTSNMG